MTRREKKDSSMRGGCFPQVLENGDILRITDYGSYITKPLPESIIYCPCCKEQDKVQSKLKVNSGTGYETLNQQLSLCPNCGVAYLPKLSNLAKMIAIEKENEIIYQAFLDEEYK